MFIFPKESDLFPFGEEVGDAEVKIDTEDGNSPYITPPLGYPFLGKLYYRIYVSHYECIDVHHLYLYIYLSAQIVNVQKSQYL